MFYFLYGNSPMIEFETEKKTEEILEKYPNLDVKVIKDINGNDRIVSFKWWNSKGTG